MPQRLQVGEPQENCQRALSWMAPPANLDGPHAAPERQPCRPTIACRQVRKSGPGLPARSANRLNDDDPMLHFCPPGKWCPILYSAEARRNFCLALSLIRQRPTTIRHSSPERSAVALEGRLAQSVTDRSDGGSRNRIRHETHEIDVSSIRSISPAPRADRRTGPSPGESPSLRGYHSLPSSSAVPARYSGSCRPHPRR
jgi:hypothetical protein